MKQIIFILVSIIMPVSLCFGQQECRGIDIITKELIKANYVKSHRFINGFGISAASRIDSQYLRYEELKNCASIAALTSLVASKNNIVTIFAWKALLEKQPKQALNFLLENADSLSQREVSVFLNTCQGTIENSVERFMVYELYDKLLSKEVEFSSSEIVSFLILKEKSQFRRHAGTGF